MATKSYADLAKEMEALQAKMDKAREEEVAGAVQQVQEIIQLYGLTAHDLGFKIPGRRGRPSGSGPKQTRAIKYQDKQGNSWSGVGKRPNWLKTAMEAGATMESFEVKS